MISGAPRCHRRPARCCSSTGEASRESGGRRPEHQRRGRRRPLLLRFASDSEVRLQVAADRASSKHFGLPIAERRAGVVAVTARERRGLEMHAIGDEQGSVRGRCPRWRPTSGWSMAGVAAHRRTGCVRRLVSASDFCHLRTMATTSRSNASTASEVRGLSASCSLTRSIFNSTRSFATS